METVHITERIIGCCFKVHQELGPGFPESVYHSALVASMEGASLLVERERRFLVTFQGVVVGRFRVDVLVERNVVVEVKAVTGQMPKVFEAQLLAYLRATALPVGLLVNFGNRSCQVRRISS